MQQPYSMLVKLQPFDRRILPLLGIPVTYGAALQGISTSVNESNVSEDAKYGGTFTVVPVFAAIVLDRICPLVSFLYNMHICCRIEAISITSETKAPRGFKPLYYVTRIQCHNIVLHNDKRITIVFISFWFGVQQFLTRILCVQAHKMRVPMENKN